MKALVIGISGATCSGKTTLTLDLKKMFPRSKVFHQDDYFYKENDPRHIWCEDVDHINYDILSSLDMEKMLSDVKSIVERRQLCKMRNSRDKLIFTSDISHSDLCARINKLIQEKDIELVFLDGFLLYGYKPLLPIMTFKYFHLLNKEECIKRRATRVYDPPDIPGYFDKCVWPEYLKHLEEIESSNDDITYFTNKSENVMNVILNDIYDCLQRD